MADLMDDIADQVPALRRYALALTQDRDRADDLVQDCLERAIRKRRLWRPSGSLKSWLFKVMVNVNRNQVRRSDFARNSLPIEEVRDPARLSEQAPQVDRIALGQTADALARLPEDQKEVLTLVVLEGVSYREAAEILNIPQGTVMSRLSRARQNLTRLTEEGAEKTVSVRTVK